MKAIVYTKYGPPEDVLEFKEVQKPAPKYNEVLVKIFASSINDGDNSLINGKPFIARLSSGLLKPRYTIPGGDIAGQVEAVGANVKQFQPGDEIYGDIGASGFGAYAEYVSAPENMLTKKPVNLSYEEAAAVPQYAVVALQGLRNKGRIEPGKKVLIIGASGGVGTFAVQIAKSFGAEVTGVCSSKNSELVRSLGADHVIDYTQGDFTRRGESYDLILDNVSSRPISDSTRVLSPNGIYVAVAFNPNALIMGPLISMAGNKKVIQLVHEPNVNDLIFMRELIEAGKVAPVIAGRYPLSETAEAFRQYGIKHPSGKIVLMMPHEGTER